MSSIGPGLMVGFVLSLALKGFLTKLSIPTNGRVLKMILVSFTIRPTII
jgi:hypothetical protein